MPMYLKRETIRLLESSVESISIALTALGLPRRFELREEASENAIAIGLAGVATELAMSAVIVQADGEKALTLPSGFYKTGSRIVDDFKTLVSTRPPKMMFLTQGVENPTAHIDEILSKISKCKLLVKSRAGGLHAGRGPSRDVCIACINDVIELIELLGKSTRIKPYTATLPKEIGVQKSYDLIVDDLIKRMKDSLSLKEKANALSSVYLVLPNLPENEPEWMEAFERLLVSPKDSDISFLLDTLEGSSYASLLKVSKSEMGMPYAVKPGEEGALPIEPQFLKKSFTNIHDRWAADRSIANGRLDEGMYDPPPIESVYEIFTFGFEKLKITSDEEKKLNATDTWSLICSSLSYAGTTGPIWYFVRKTVDLGQLYSYIKRAKRIGDTKLNNRFNDFKLGFESIQKGVPLSRKNKLISDFVNKIDIASLRKDQLLQRANKYMGKTKGLPENAFADIELVTEGEALGEVLVKLVEGKYDISTYNRAYWARILCEAAFEIEDTEGLLAVLKAPAELSVAHTAARKALQIIDFFNYGPKVE